MTTVPHPVTGKAYPLILTASQAAESIGMTWEAVVKLAEAGEIPCAPHASLDRWRIYTLPLWQKFGLEAAS